MVPGLLPFASAAFATDRSPPLPPAKVVGLDAQAGWLLLWPTDFGGTAVLGEATDGDGDENGSGIKTPGPKRRNKKQVHKLSTMEQT